jgi:hypothetical protein
MVRYCLASGRTVQFAKPRILLVIDDDMMKKRAIGIGKYSSPRSIFASRQS